MKNENKIIRSICYFSDNPNNKITEKISNIGKKLEKRGYVIQTKRICSAGKDIEKLNQIFNNKGLLLAVGSLGLEDTEKQLDSFYSANSLSFNIELSNKQIEEKYVEVLFDIIKNKPANTFNFTYVFNNKNSSPYFPSANYEKNGFSIGLQPTNLSENCNTLDEWLCEMKKVWLEIFELFKDESDFLGIDSSIAPLFSEKQSLVNFVNKTGVTFSESVITDFYIKITKFIKEENPKPVGLCGLMFPCLEDFELADEYEKGNFSIERNIYLSLHSGLGIDTYPIGIDEDHNNVLGILCLIQGLSNKYNKPLSVRFVSDGKAKIGEKTDFQNKYLKDVIVKKLR